MSIFKNNLETFGEYGVVEAVYHPVVVVSGLPNVFPKEIVVFENDVRGQVLTLSRDMAEILLFSHYPVRVGQKLTRTGKPMKIPLGNYMVGQILDPLGRPLLPIEVEASTLTTEVDVDYAETLIASEAEEEREVDISPPSMIERVEIRRSFLTGVSIVDSLLPLGKGQREIIVGDRKTGKTSFLLSAMKGHALAGGMVVYAAVGKKSIELESLRNYLVSERLLKNVVMIATTSHDAASLIYLSPFTAMTIAEYFKDKGMDVLVVMDDLSTHAKFYREIALLAHRFPGRDSYPGDIFFTHARLLERAGNFVHPTAGEASITCMPVAETTENDLTDYIVSNLIGITDGHILFDTSEFIKGRRPAINPSLSVTRVGKQTQSTLHQEVNTTLMALLVQYERSQTYSHFGAELSKDVQKLLVKGQLLYSFFNQLPSVVIPLSVQILIVGLILSECFDSSFVKQMGSFRACVVQTYFGDKRFRLLIDQGVSVDNVEDLKKNALGIKDELFRVCLV